MSGAVWPDERQMLLLQALVGQEREALAALDQLDPSAEVDGSSRQLLPLLYRRWPSRTGTLFTQGWKAHLANWKQGRDRMRQAAEVTQRFAAAGISTLLLKGAAMALRYYREGGVRPMRDIDVLIHADHVERAAEILLALGYAAEGGLSPTAIADRRRIGHGWQFFLNGEQSCDLHWRPVVRCFAPEVTEAFWASKEYAGGFDVPGPAAQLFHTCAHALQWDWEPQVRWVADAVTVLREPVEWSELRRLAARANMSVRLARALAFLAESFSAPVPDGLAAEIEQDAPAWEREDYELMLKACPLGFRDRVRWHLLHFRRIRAHDPVWRNQPAWLGFPDYLASFLGASGGWEFAKKLLPELWARGAAERRADR